MTKQTVVEITYKDTPLTCPMPGEEQWNAHPKVMLPIEETGKAKCPYCGTEYILTDFDPHHSHH